MVASTSFDFKYLSKDVPFFNLENKRVENKHSQIDEAIPRFLMSPLIVKELIQASRQSFELLYGFTGLEFLAINPSREVYGLCR